MVDAKYDLPPYVLSRVRYYDGAFLKDDEFIDEQKYHIDRQQRHDRLLHVAGVCEGLVASRLDEHTIKVSAGTAIDDQGQQILVAEDRTIVTTPDDTGLLRIEILFNEVEDRFADENSAVAAHTRFTQAPLLQLSAAPVQAQHAITLGQATIDQGKIKLAGDVTAKGRAYSGLRLPGPAGAGYGLLARGDATPGWVELGCSLSITGALSVGSAQDVAPAKVSLGTDMANTKVALRDAPGDLYGFGVQASQLRLHLGSPGGRFSFLDAPAGNELLTLQGNGNVGIGATDPAGNKLRVTGGDVLFEGALKFGGQSRQMINLSNGSHGVGVQSSTLYFRTEKNVAVYKSGVHNDAELNSGGGTAMLVINDGNVGIGTADPAGNKLRVTGGDVLFEGALKFGAPSRQMISLSNLNHAIGVQSSTLYLRTDKNIAIYKGGVHNDAELSAGGGTAMLVVSNGSVGIGTAAPQAKLDVAGTLTAANLLTANGGLTIPASQTLTVNGKTSSPKGSFVASNEGALRVVRGHVGRGGGILSGTGFTVTTLDEWLYQINYAANFASTPCVVASMYPLNGQPGFVTINGSEPTRFQMCCHVAQDLVFEIFFIAIAL